MDFLPFLKQAAAVHPSPRQAAWFETEFYAFVHFGVNTYTNREWGLGNEDPAIFNPARLDCDQWVEAIKSAGMKGLVLTAKHHDGFCLWPSAHTDHSVAKSPWKGGRGDVVREAAEACKRGGIKFGVYLSPWDRHSPLYGSEAYNDYYLKQLTELLTGYGELFMVWFDGACGEGPNGRRQEYDFPAYIDLVRRHQPNAVIFHDGGPDVRWVGNESGTARASEWAVVPRELAHRSEAQTGPGPLTGDLGHMYNTQPDIGALHNILYSQGLCFCPSEMDMSIRPGWFYHPEEEPHSLRRLIETYETSVGANACFHLNIPPMPSGLFDPRDVLRLEELGDALRAMYGDDLAKGAVREDFARAGGTQSDVVWTLAEPREIRRVVLAEDIQRGQRVESFLIEGWDAPEGWKPAYAGTAIGHKKICPVQMRTDKIRLCVTAARDAAHLLDIKAYG